jgi:H+/Cl- antiporter ClcA
MSIMSIASPLQAVLGFGLLATLAILFKPLLTGSFRALKLLLKPSMSKEQRLARAYYRNAVTLHSMSSASDTLPPNLAAELRALSGRG